MDEFNAFLEGMKRAYMEDYLNVILETNHVNAYWEWKNSTIKGGVPEHAYIIKQLNTSRRDTNLADPEDNMLAAYFADQGAEKWKQMVVVKKPFGRVHKLWSLDMRLGPVGHQFQVYII
ncbi:hypothetical protein POM88_045226 [Heracleum sosnowskyi]|uniref:Uncharacterized protein n=1 Tax=Heracleum sosnowskyi TaxID=360622 RepID=A0AAD8M5Y9_9APIA|nr:hypothetical protein POM88_045226 [Heracleum sosnowskyi]